MKKCEKCGLEFIKNGTNHRFCGNRKNKTRCAWEREKVSRCYTLRPYLRLREELLLKYDNRCLFCSSNENLSIDHIIPQMIGGKDEIDNLRILCLKCNDKRHLELTKNALLYYFSNGFTE